MKEQDLEKMDLERMLVNPVYTGIGPYPTIIDDKTFIKTGVKMIERIGPERYLEKLIEALRESFKGFEER